MQCRLPNRQTNQHNHLSKPVLLCPPLADDRVHWCVALTLLLAPTYCRQQARMPELRPYGNVAEPPATVLSFVEREPHMQSGASNRGTAAGGDQNGRPFVPAVRWPPPPPTGTDILGNGSCVASGYNGRTGGSSPLHACDTGRYTAPDAKSKQSAQVCIAK